MRSKSRRPTPSTCLDRREYGAGTCGSSIEVRTLAPPTILRDLAISVARWPALLPTTGLNAAGVECVQKNGAIGCGRGSLNGGHTVIYLSRSDRNGRYDGKM